MNLSISETGIRQRIHDLNLEHIAARMIGHYRWSKKAAMLAIHQYKNFLFLKWKYGKTHSLPPSIEIDEIWHNHILHTEQYHEDCRQIFGRYLHHKPEHGVTPQIAQRIERLFEEGTQRLYQLEFAEPILSIR